MEKEMPKRIKIIKEFAEKMGYTIFEEVYKKNNRPCYSIELLETSDIEGNPYSWEWYLDTGEEISE